METTKSEKLAVDLRTASAMLSVSRRTLENYIRAKRLPARKIGRRTVVLVRALENFLRSDQPSPALKPNGGGDDSCGAGGDKVSLVRAVRTCSFREALRFLASLTGVEFEQDKSCRADIERFRQERQAEERAAYLLADAEHGLLLELAEELESLRRLRRKAGASLARGQRPELCWLALEFVADTLPRTDAAYCISAFAAPVEQARFALRPELRPSMIDSARTGVRYHGEGLSF